MEKLQKLSRRLKATFQILTFAVPIFIVLQWLLIDWSFFNNLAKSGVFFNSVATSEGTINFATISLTPMAKFIGCFGQLLGSLPYVLGYMLLEKLFSAYQKGNIFISSNTQIYKKLGWLAFFNGILIIPLTQTLMVLAATLSNPPGHRYITLSFGTPNLEAILCGLLVIVIAWVMEEAQSLSEENQLTV